MEEQSQGTKVGCNWTGKGVLRASRNVSVSSGPRHLQLTPSTGQERRVGAAKRGRARPFQELKRDQRTLKSARPDWEWCAPASFKTKTVRFRMCQMCCFFT